MAPAVPYRAGRAAVVGATGTVVGAAVHLLSGGSIRPVLVPVTLLAAIAAVWLLAGRERGWWGIAAIQVGVQQAVHAILAAGAVHPAPDLLPHDMMLHAHVVAGCLVATLLRVGERRVWASARRLVARVREWCTVVLRTPVRPRARALVIAVAGTRATPRRPLCDAPALRGPPALLPA